MKGRRKAWGRGRAAGRRPARRASQRRARSRAAGTHKSGRSSRAAAKRVLAITLLAVVHPPALPLLRHLAVRILAPVVRMSVVALWRRLMLLLRRHVVIDRLGVVLLSVTGEMLRLICGLWMRSRVSASLESKESKDAPGSPSQVPRRTEAGQIGRAHV